MVVPVSDHGLSPVRYTEFTLLLRVADTLKSGNVDRRHDFSDLHFEQFLTGAVGAAAGPELIGSGAPVGEAFGEAVVGMSRQGGGNTQFGCLLLLVPLARAAADDDHDPSSTGAIVVAESAIVADAAGLYRAFEHVDVVIGDVPDDAPDFDVRRDGDTAEVLRNRGRTLYDMMALDADRDVNAHEWTGDFVRTLRVTEVVLAGDGPVIDRVARMFLDLFVEESNTLVVMNHGEAVARDVMDHVAAVSDLAGAEELADEFIAEGIDPGTIADIICVVTFVALERGVLL